jgi:hypothetical protein
MISDIQNIINESLADEVRKTILNEGEEGQEVFHITCEGEPVDTFKTEEEANTHLDIYKKKHPEKEFIIEKTKYNSYSEMIDKMEDLGEKIEVKETKTMEKKTVVKVKNLTQAVLDAKEKGLKEFKVGEETYNVDECWKQLEEEEMCAECGDMNEEGDVEESNAFVLAADAAKDAGEDEFEFPKGSGKMHKVTLNKNIDVKEGMGECNECGAMLNEEGMCSECGSPMNESKSNTLRLTESELVSLISKMVNEAVPGLEVTKRAQKGSGDESKSHMADVEKKLKDVSSFDGNDNPEFPKAIGKGETVAQRSDEKENETIEDYRGGGLEDLNYDYEPSERFKERLKKALEGDSTMGNSQDAANVIKTDTGKKIKVKAERKAKKISKEPQISWGHAWKEPEKVNVVNESEKPTMSSILEEEIKRMKKILGYDERTQ